MAKQPKLGSGERFQRLSSTLAARGAQNPDALAAWIGRRKYGVGKMGKLSHAHAGFPGGLLLAAPDTEEGGRLTCPGCGYTGSASSFSGNDLSPSSQKPGELRTPDRTSTDSAGMSPGQIGVAGGSAPHALSATGQRSIGLAQRLPVSSATDILVSRGDDGKATVRHRRGGTTIGQLWRGDDGSWHSQTEGGNELTPHTHQRGSLLELLGTWNRSAVRPDRWAQPLPAAAPPQQTPLMAQYGIPAVRSLATPTAGASDGPRTTGSDAGGGTGPAGLSPKGQSIYKKLLAKGFPAARALAFARNSQNAKAGQFGKAG